MPRERNSAQRIEHTKLWMSYSIIELMRFSISILESWTHDKWRIGQILEIDPIIPWQNLNLMVKLYS